MIADGRNSSTRMSEDSRRRAPSIASLLWIGAAAAVLRVALFVLVGLPRGATLLDWAAAADGGQYLRMASDWLTGPHYSKLDPAIGRLFPGLPALIAALVGLGAPPWAAALLPSWLGSAAVCVLAGRWTGSTRVAWALATVPPIFLYAGSLISTEVVCLVLSLAALLSARRERWPLAGLCFGAAGWVRPFAIFAAIGWAVAMLRQGKVRPVSIVAAVSCATFGAGTVLTALRVGDPWLSFRTYAAVHQGGILEFPFGSLLRVSFASETPTWKLFYVWSHVAVGVVGLIAGVRRIRSAEPQREDLLWTAFLWWAGTLGFALSAGTDWGFHDFPRYLSSGLPALFLLIDDFLPRRSLLWIAVGAASLYLAAQPARRNFTPAAVDPFDARRGEESAHAMPSTTIDLGSRRASGAWQETRDGLAVTGARS